MTSMGKARRRVKVNALTRNLVLTTARKSNEEKAQNQVKRSCKALGLNAQIHDALVAEQLPIEVEIEHIKNMVESVEKSQDNAH